MSVEPIDDGGPAYPRGSTLTDDGQVWTTSQTGQSYRADVAKECLAALMGRPDLDTWTPEELVDDAIMHADTLIERLKGGAR